MTGLDGSNRSLLTGRHPSGCEGKEFSTLEAAPYGHGFAIVRLEWCGDCGACDWEWLDEYQPDPAEVAKYE